MKFFYNLLTGKSAAIAYHLFTCLLFNRATRRALLSYLEQVVKSQLSPDKNNRYSNRSPRILFERKTMISAILHAVRSAIDHKTIKPAVVRAVLKLWADAVIIPREKSMAVQEFRREYGCRPPWFLVISPGHACNLHCKDCYASSGQGGASLTWDSLQRLVKDARRLWDIKLVVFSGGEPLAYHAQGKGILDIVEQHPECLFLAFTNGTLINRQVAGRIARLKNLTPAISVEGMREATDERRGAGIFDRVLQSMQYLREAGVPFGISVTVSRHNYLKVLSDEFLEFFFHQQGAFYGFYFQYLPIGRNASFEDMPLPEHRVEFWQKIWDVIASRGLFLIDFWNHGPLVNGCIAAGRDGGYLYIDWNGKVMPCVFAPYSAGNLNKLHAGDRQLNSLWEAPFFATMRKWQLEHGFGNKSPQADGNWLRPCPYRDHHTQFLEMVRLHSAEPEDAAAVEALSNREYHEKLMHYDQELATLFDPIWQKEYLE